MTEKFYQCIFNYFLKINKPHKTTNLKKWFIDTNYIYTPYVSTISIYLP